MDLIFNVIAAWLSVFLLAMLVVIWILRLGIKRVWFSPQSLLGRMNRQLRVAHRWLGLAFIAASLVHGIYASEALISLNLGTACFVAGILLGVTYLFKKRMKRSVWLRIHRMLSVLVVVLLVIHLIDIGGAPATKALIRTLQADQTATAETESDIIDAEEESLLEWANDDMTQDYTDGTYSGTADGFGGEMTVAVTIESGLITEIIVVSHNEEGEQFYGPAIAQIPEEIIAAQSVQVDSVSGSTYTSVGIKNAVADALNQASVSGTVLEEENLPEGEHRGGRGRENEREGE